MVLHGVTGFCVVLHDVKGCYTVVHVVTRCHGRFPPLPVFLGKSLGDEVVRARVYLLVCTCTCLRARFCYCGLLLCVTFNTVTCEARQKFGPFIVHGVKT